MFASPDNRNSGFPDRRTRTEVLKNLGGILVNRRDAFDGLEEIDKYVFDTAQQLNQAYNARLREIQQHISVNRQLLQSQGRNVGDALDYLDFLITYAEKKTAT